MDPEFSGTFVVVGPSHRGYLTCASAIPWETPVGIVDVDTAFVEELGIEVDEFSHQGEHSLEVQMPFIRYRFPRARVAPVMMGDQSPQSAADLAGKIGKARKKTGREIRIVASSDFSHYVPEGVARSNDLYAIEALKDLDTGEFYRRVGERGVSACGYGPIATLCLAGREMGASTGRAPHLPDERRCHGRPRGSGGLCRHRGDVGWLPGPRPGRSSSSGSMRWSMAGRALPWPSSTASPSR